MQPRRSRLGRLYRRMTRRQPDRKAQWNQITKLRPSSSLGYPATQAATCAAQPAHLTHRHEVNSPWEISSDWLEPFAEGHDVAHSNGASRSGRATDHHIPTSAAAVALSLFLLGFAFSGFAAFVFIHSATLARCGVWCAVVSLVAAGIEVRLAAAPTRKTWQVPYAVISTVTLGSVFITLIWLGYLV